MAGWSHDPAAVDSDCAAESLAPPSVAARDAADRTDFGDSAVERSSGAESTSARQLRARSRDVRRRANRNAGEPERRGIPAKNICRAASRRLAGIPRAGRPRSDRRTLIPPIGDRAAYVAGGGRKCAGDWKNRFAIVPVAAGRDAG